MNTLIAFVAGLPIGIILYGVKRFFEIDAREKAEKQAKALGLKQIKY